MYRNCSTNQRQGNSGNSEEHDQKLIRPVESHMGSPTKFELNPTSDLQMYRNCLTNHRPVSGGNSAEHDQKLIRPGGSHKSSSTKFELNPTSGLSVFFQQMQENWSTNQRPGNGGNSAKCDQKLIRPGEYLMSSSDKFKLNPTSGLYVNVQKLLDQSGASKWWEFNGAWPKVSQACIMNASTKFDINYLSGLPENAGQPQ